MSAWLDKRVAHPRYRLISWVATAFAWGAILERVIF